jgi:CHAT domain-containing protein/tetratricopeptide (TPR) repeat protein
MRILLAAVLLFSTGAPRERLDALFDATSVDFRAGELPKAQLETEHGMALAAARGDALSQWKFRLLRCDILLLDASHAGEVAQQLDEGTPNSPEFAALGARRMLLQSRAISMLGGRAESNGLLESAQRGAEAAHAEDVLMDIEILQGGRLTRQQRYDESDHVLLRARERAWKLKAPFSEAAADLNLGVSRIKRHRYDEALPYLEAASRLARQQARILYPVAQTNLAICYSQLGEYERAIRIHLESVAQHERSGASFYLEGSLGETGYAYASNRQFKEAIPYLQRALRLARGIPRSQAPIWAGDLAECYTEVGDWQNAASLNQEAIRLKTAAGAKTLFYNVLNGANIAAGRGDATEAARLYRQAIADGKEDPSVVWESHEGLGSLALGQKQPALAVEHFAAAVAVLEQTRANVASAELRLPFLTRRIRLYQEYIDTLTDQGQWDRAFAVADSSRAQALGQRGSPVDIRRLPPEAFRELARRTHSLLLSYWLGPARSHAWLVDGRDIHYAPLPASGQIEPLVREYQDSIEHRLVDPLRTRIPSGERLYQTIVEPLKQWIPPGAHIIVATDGALHGLNPEALPVPGDSPHFWIQDVTLSLTPSFALLAGRAPAAAPDAAPRLLLLGDPVVNDPSFPALTHAAAEIEGVKRGFEPANRVVLTAAAATPQAYRMAEPARFSAIHFTAHAIANFESPLDSAVLLTGGKLYARDVMDVPLTANLVTVSACRGAGLRNYSGEGLVGLAWVFLHAGARNVIAGLWDVNDESTAALMDVLYRELAAGKAPADALWAAKRSLIQSAGNMRKPYYWAPFQMYTAAP